MVQSALRKPYTVAAAAILLAIGGVFSANRMPMDIFPASAASPTDLCNSPMISGVTG